MPVVTGVKEELSHIEKEQWIIHNFSSLPIKLNDYTKSPLMHLHDESWYLQIYPGGSNESEGFISLYLYRKSASEKGIETKYKFSLYNYLENKFTFVNSGLSTFSRISPIWGYSKFVKKAKLIDPKNGYIENDQIIIEVEVQVKKPVEKDWILPSTFQNDMESYLKKGVHSDITFIIGRKKFKAHKSFLAIRAPILHALLEDDSEILSIS